MYTGSAVVGIGLLIALSGMVAEGGVMSILTVLSIVAAPVFLVISLGRLPTPGTITVVGTTFAVASSIWALFAMIAAAKGATNAPQRATSAGYSFVFLGEAVLVAAGVFIESGSFRQSPKENHRTEAARATILEPESGTHPSSSASTYVAPTLQSTASAPPGRLDAKMVAALSEVRAGLDVALEGLNTGKLDLDSAVSVLAVGLSNALYRCSATTPEETQLRVGQVVAFLRTSVRERFPGIADDVVEKLLQMTATKAVELLARQQQKAERLEESLEVIREGVVTAWTLVASGKISRDDAVIVMALAVVSALRNSIGSSSQLKDHLSAFNAWMLTVADQAAPGVDGETKALIVNSVWDRVFEMILHNSAQQ